ncbi:uncharacterized protein FA14DRAFT_184655, partial [Meira miltonrushii]
SLPQKILICIHKAVLVFFLAESDEFIEYNSVETPYLLFCKPIKMLTIRALLMVALAASTSTLKGIECTDDKAKGNLQSVKSPESPVYRTSGSYEYHQIKASRNRNLLSRAKVAHARQIAQSLKNPKQKITKTYNMKPVVDYFDVKTTKNDIALWLLTKKWAKPGPKTLKKMRLEEAAASASGQK